MRLRLFSEPHEVDRVFAALAETVEQTTLWWTRGGSHNNISTIIRDSSGFWLIDYREVKPCRVFIYKHPHDLVRNFVLCENAGLPSYGLYDAHDSGHEEAGLLDGQYISRECFDDGYALINGESVSAKNAQLRVRDLKRKFYFFAPQLSFLINSSSGAFADQQIRAFLESIEDGTTDVSLESLQALLALRKDPRIIDYR